MKKETIVIKVGNQGVCINERLRIKQSTLCKMLDITPQTIRELRESDPKFPVPIKLNNLRQAAIYYDYEEILHWYENLKKAR